MRPSLQIYLAANDINHCFVSWYCWLISVRRITLALPKWLLYESRWLVRTFIGSGSSVSCKGRCAAIHCHVILVCAASLKEFISAASTLFENTHSYKSTPHNRKMEIYRPKRNTTNENRLDSRFELSPPTDFIKSPHQLWKVGFLDVEKEE